MSEIEPSRAKGGDVRRFVPAGRSTVTADGHAPPLAPAPQVTFDQRELRAIMRLYGFMVAAGEWRDYAIDTLKDRAIFSVFRRSSEMPLYSIEKTPRNARRQGAYALVAPGGRILKLGHEIETVLRVLRLKAAG